MSLSEQDRIDIISWATEDVSMALEKEDCLFSEDRRCVHGFRKRRLFSEN